MTQKKIDLGSEEGTDMFNVRGALNGKYYINRTLRQHRCLWVHCSEDLRWREPQKVGGYLSWGGEHCSFAKDQSC